MGMNAFEYPMCNVILFFFQAHEDLNQGHKTIGIVAYRDSAFADEIRYCDQHTSEPSTMGCRVCWKILCPLCVTTDKKCEDGKCFFAMRCFYHRSLIPCQSGTLKSFL